MVEARPALVRVESAQRSRVTGVDAARGIALLGMIAVHIFPMLDTDGTPSTAWSLFGGRSAALFGLLAGVSIAFMTGGRRILHGRERMAASTSLALRAVIIGLIGLALGYVTEDAAIILTFYGALFLMAIPLLGLTSRALAGLAVITAIAAPVLMQGTRDALPEARNINLTFGFAAGDPIAFLSELFITGVFPALPWFAYICAGLAIGRLGVASATVAVRLLAAGVALSVAAWVTSWALLGPLGGMERLEATAGLDAEGLEDLLLYGPDPGLPTTSWWWLAVRAPHSSTPVDLLLTIGTAMAVLGMVLLLSRVTGPLLSPLAIAGSMTLTLYVAHVLLFGSGVFSDMPLLSFVVQVSAVLVFAVLWRRSRGQGPLERMVSAAANGARRGVLAVPGVQDQASVHAPGHRAPSHRRPRYDR